MSGILTVRKPGELEGVSALDHDTNIAPPSAAEPGDEALLARVAAGEAPAWEDLVGRHADAVYSLSVRMLGRCPEAEDAVQETFLRVRKSAHTFQHDGNARGWILKIACREAMKMSIRRTQTRRRNAPLESAAEPAGRHDARAERRDLHELLRRAVDELPDAIREAVVMHFGAEMSQVEIAKELNCNQTTVSYRIRQGLEKLRARLGAAAVTPVALGKCLLAESAPEALHASVLNVAAKAAAGSLRYSRPLLAAKSGSAVGVATALVLGAGLAIGGYVMLAEPPAAKSAVPEAEESATPAPAATAPQQAPAAKPQAPKVHQRWSFNEKPAAPFFTFQGRWHWRAPGKDHPGGIYFPSGNVHTGWVLPVKLNHRDVRLALKVRPISTGDADQRLSDIGAGWTDGAAILEFMPWLSGTAGPRINSKLRLNFEVYLVRNFSFELIENELVGITEYRTPYPGDQVFVHGSNWAVEEMEIRELEAGEVPAELVEIAKIGPVVYAERIKSLSKPIHSDIGGTGILMRSDIRNTNLNSTWSPSFRFDQIDVDKELKDAEGE